MPNKPEIIMPTDKEDKAINADIEADPDAFEFTDDMVAQSTSLEASSLPESFKRAVLGRPISSNPKKPTNIRLPSNVIDFFKAGSEDGKGWQTRLSSVLEDYVKTHKTR